MIESNSNICESYILEVTYFDSTGLCEREKGGFCLFG
jgi:hypothetical protein